MSKQIRLVLMRSYIKSDEGLQEQVLMLNYVTEKRLASSSHLLRCTINIANVTLLE